ncbi:MAG: endonuclease/exonuclease/phosphatase family protein [Deltaproteobacteria bacterium]|nr:endonuclease/exonuclease/phosphatase family protein [Deltaproteobacteria bacterium]
MPSRADLLRLITLNIWQEQGPWQERLALTVQRLRALAPDVLCLQEVRQVPGRIENQARTLADALGMHCIFDVAQDWGGGDEGLAILSKHEISDPASEALPFTEGRSRRICLGGHLSIGDRRLAVYTTHLAYRLSDGLLRERQVLAAEQFIRQHAGVVDLTIFSGDFNAAPESDEIRFLKGLTTIDERRSYFQDAYEVCNPGQAGHSWAADNPYTAQLSWLPPRRLDYVFVSARRRDGVGAIRDARLVLTEPDERGVWCSDHYGVLCEIVI